MDEETLQCITYFQFSWMTLVFTQWLGTGDRNLAFAPSGAEQGPKSDVC